MRREGFFTAATWAAVCFGGAAFAQVGCTNLAAWRNLSPAAAPAASTPRRLEARDDAELLRLVREAVPVGTSLAQAEAIMRHEGFDCSFGHDSQQQQDFLQCTRSESQSLLVSRRRQIRFPYHDGMVVGAEMSGGWVGP